MVSGVDVLTGELGVSMLAAEAMESVSLTISVSPRATIFGDLDSSSYFDGCRGVPMLVVEAMEPDSLTISVSVRATIFGDLDSSPSFDGCRGSLMLRAASGSILS
jgi:hypothetical protein